MPTVSQAGSLQAYGEVSPDPGGEIEPGAKGEGPKSARPGREEAPMEMSPEEAARRLAEKMHPLQTVEHVTFSPANLDPREPRGVAG